MTLDVRLKADTVWLSQGQMAELFGRERSVITRHVGNVFREGELPEPCNVHFLHAFGSDRPVLHRHLIQGLASHHQHVKLDWLATGCNPTMRSVGAFEAKTHLAALLDAVAAGDQITITRHGRPVARLVPPDDQVRPDVAATIERLRSFSEGQTLGNLSWRELRDQGRP